MFRRRRVKVPTVLQMETVECGAASLAMILAYYGRYESLSALRSACGVSRDGSRASHMLRAARSYGLQAKGLRTETEALRSARVPAILFWNFDHYVVLEGFGGDYAHLNDPAVGRVKVPMAEFERRFTGVALVFEPGPLFKKGGQRPRPVRSMLRYLGGNRAAVLYIVLVTILLAIPNLAVPAFTRVFVDDVLIGGNRNWVHPLLLAMAGAIVLIGGLSALQQSALLRLERRVGIVWGSRAIWRALLLPVEFFAHRSASELAVRMRLPDRISTILAGELAANLAHILITGFYAALMFQYDATLAALGCGMGFLNAAALHYVARRNAADYGRLSQELGKLYGTVTNHMAAIETIKAGGQEGTSFAMMTGKYAAALAAEQKLLVVSRTMAAAPGLIAGVGTAALLTTGGWRVLDGAMTAGMLVAFQGLLLSFLQPLERLTMMSAQLQQTAVDATRLEDVLAYPPDSLAVDTEGTGDGFEIHGEVQLKGVTFGYNPLDPPLIQDLHVTIKPGTRVALVGASGSGKSTVARLVSGLYKPWAGEILIDGKPLAALPRDVRAQAMALVEQEPFLLEGTVRQNIAMWDSSIDEQWVGDALRDACLADDVRGRADGLNSTVEEGGRNWSGGQRQRMEIARALAGNPRILILDEATSALDPVTEKRVDDHIRRRGCTCLIVAHRLSTIRDADEIIVLDGGRVAERGNHAELMARGEAYARLVGSD